jgi:hypothetical protein
MTNVDSVGWFLQLAGSTPAERLAKNRSQSEHDHPGDERRKHGDNHIRTSGLSNHPTNVV